MAAAVAHTAWVRTLNAYSDGSPSKWVPAGWGANREDAVDALEHWLACNYDERHEWVLLEDHEIPQPKVT